MNKVANENPLGLKWTWYLFLCANILVVLGIAIAWIWRHNNLDASPNAIYSVIVVCNILALVAVAIFYYLDLKDMILIKQHLKKSTLAIYFAAGFIFIAAVLFSFIYNMFTNKIAAALNTDAQGGNAMTFDMTYIIAFAITCVITLVAIAMYRYAKYKIDLTIFRRRRGEETTTTDSTKDTPPASSNLIDHAGN